MIRYQYSGDEIFSSSAPQVVNENSDDWWGGVQKCAAVVAIAAGLAVATLSTQVAAATVDIGGADEIPAGQLHGQPDEDFWENQTSPVVWPNLYPQPWTFEQNEPAGALHGQPDEDYWQSGVEPIASYPPPILFRDDDVIATPLTVIGTDEDFWINPAGPVNWNNLAPQQWAFDVQEPGGLHGRPDEDFSIPAAQPAIPIIFPQPFQFDAGEIAFPSSSPFVPDEDFWEVQIYSSPPQSPQIFADDASFAPTVAPPFVPDEDFAALRIQSPALNSWWPQPWQFETEDTGGLFGVPEESTWSAPLVQAPISPRIVFSDDSDLPRAVLDEDFWASSSPQASLRFGSLYLPDPELGAFIPPSVNPLDDTFWASPLPAYSSAYAYLPLYLDQDWLGAARGPLAILGAKTIPAASVLGCASVPALAILGAKTTPPGGR